tara:strand:- start:852 stop:1337 length:486 start_codon:yes stop_codon:yes gene_type:complete
MLKFKHCFTTLLCLIILSGCGFKPIHKLSDNSNSLSFLAEITNSVSREIVEEVNDNLFQSDNKEYKAQLTISEDSTPLIINTNGTVAKYRIEIEINYKLVKIGTNEVISEGTTRGSAQYDVVDSEISNEDTRKNMTKIATKNALQIMISRIQSSIIQLNDN